MGQQQQFSSGNKQKKLNVRIAIKSYFGSQWILLAKPSLKTKQITISLKRDCFKNRRTTPHPHYEEKKNTQNAVTHDILWLLFS